MTSRDRVRASILLISALTLFGPGLVFAQPSVEAPQASVVRWASATAESCGMDGRTYAAIDGECFYPIDFNRAPARIEVGRWQAGQGMERAWVDVVEKEFGDQDIEFPDDSFVHLSAEDLARHYQEQAAIKPIFRRRGEARFTMPLGAPLDPMVEGKYFGVHRTFNGEPKNAHTGTDYAINLGTPVKAVADGTVALTGEHFFAGRSVYIDHGGGLISMFFHLDSIDVEIGQEVKRGDDVAKVGSTGRSTGPHLHLGLRWRGARVDPSPLMVDLEVPELN